MNKSINSKINSSSQLDWLSSGLLSICSRLPPVPEVGVVLEEMVVMIMKAVDAAIFVVAFTPSLSCVDAPSVPKFLRVTIFFTVLGEGVVSEEMVVMIMEEVDDSAIVVAYAHSLSCVAVPSFSVIIPN